METKPLQVSDSYLEADRLFLRPIRVRDFKSPARLGPSRGQRREVWERHRA
ncbi:MAG: hypothetical protein ABI247_14875 [Rhodanobacter sp.]